MRIFYIVFAIFLPVAVYAQGINNPGPCIAFGTTAGTCSQGNDSRFSSPTITGGSINNSPIGGSTPAAGSFTIATAPTILMGGATSSFPSLVRSGTEIRALLADGSDYTQIALGTVRFGGTTPSVTGTGTPSITSGSTDSAGEVTSGAVATSVIITFSTTKGSAPFCVVTSQTQLAVFAYTISTGAITITQTETSGNKINYHCSQH